MAQKTVLDIFVKFYTSYNWWRLRSWSIILYFSILHTMVRHLNPKHFVQNVSFLKHRIKHFASDKIYPQVSSPSSRSGLKCCRAGILAARSYSMNWSTIEMVSNFLLLEDSKLLFWWFPQIFAQRFFRLQDPLKLLQTSHELSEPPSPLPFVPITLNSPPLFKSSPS